MLIINQQLDKLAASHADFQSQGMLEGTCLSTVVETLSKFPILQLIHICINIAPCNTAQEQLTEGDHQANEDNPCREPSASNDDAQDNCEDVDR